MVPLWKLLATAKKGAILNWLANTGARLVVLASEVGGRWSEACRQFLCQLAKAKVRSEPKIMRPRATQAWLLAFFPRNMRFT